MVPKVSVIIPTYNRARLVGNAIQSVLDQTFQDFEVIVVDDGSDDNTRDVISKFGEKVIYLYQENKERSVARNNGMRHAKGKYITFLDSDDIYLTDKLQLQVELMDKNSEYGMSYAYSIWLDEKGKYLHTWKGELEGWTYPNLMLTKNTKVTTPSVMIRKSILDNVGYFNEKISVCEDYEFWCRIAMVFPVLLIKKSLVIINTVTHTLKDSYKDYFKGNMLYYQSVFKLDNNIRKTKQKQIYLDLFLKFYLNSTSTIERKYVSTMASKISGLFPLILEVNRLFNIFIKIVKRYNGITTLYRFFRNYIFIILPDQVSSEDMEYGILRSVSDTVRLKLIIKYYNKNGSNSNYIIARAVDRENRKIIRDSFISCNYMSSNRIAAIFNFK